MRAFRERVGQTFRLNASRHGLPAEALFEEREIMLKYRLGQGLRNVLESFFGYLSSI